MRHPRIFLAAAVAACLAAAAAPAAAADPRYLPFPPGASPPACAVHECAVVDIVESPADWRLPVLTFEAGGAAPRVRLRVIPSLDPKGVFLSVLEGGREVLSPQLVARRPRTERAVYWADLNGDHRPDFVVFVWSGQPGLEAAMANVAFVLSAPGGYEVSVVRTWYPDPRDFLDLRADGTCRFLHVALVRGERGRDGRRHNYWVYNLLGFNGGDVVLDNGGAPEFPAWIQFKRRENHRPTDQLTDEQKARLWRPFEKGLVLKPRRS
ncbi:hypothetical protein G3N55_05450 [Dissulfurirhabdus thermomarina]|uniref:VCBS repeat-containing protein n=1 Tax=Dissulfurirhabdus thermomarina TaxID=1765737 RepID=A0A6N9TUV2_DISTH|nr:hypothetical protein [Dissulfurirhabdus thermomarina]NDY42286.1 hypothetical protein [Dissulfurirhabdus thermomarina]NMX23038.1 hypothetical protein [Dissulfurirhabdus thermomarina]